MDSTCSRGTMHTEASFPCTLDSARARVPGGTLFLWALLVSAGTGCDRNDLSDGPILSRPVAPPASGAEEATPADVVINEVMVINATTLEDGSGSLPPWIELYNPTGEPIDLGGVALSDSFIQSTRWRIPEVPEAVIPPDGFLVIFADGDTENPDDLHASFELRPAGFIQLILNSGSSLFSFGAAASLPDVSVGLFPDGKGKEPLSLRSPTPGDFNDEPEEPAERPEADFIRGDGDEDERVTFRDVLLLTRVLAGLEQPPVCEDRLDANDDGMIDAVDQVFLNTAVFDDSVRIPEPFPSAGKDPTPDGLPCPLP